MPDQFNEAWLSEQVPKVSIAVAARATLRILPALALEFDMQESRPPEKIASTVVLPVFRAMHLAWAAARFSNHDTKLTASVAAAAATAAVAAADAAVDNTAARVADAARAAAAAVSFAARGDAATDTATAVEAADDVASAAARAAYVDVLADDVAAIEAGLTADDLAARPLWPNGPPQPLEALWRRLADCLLTLDEGWDVWTDWYEARQEGRPADESLEVDRATIADDIWRQKPKDVNAHLIEPSPPDPGDSGPPSSGTDQRPRPAVWLAQFKSDREWVSQWVEKARPGSEIPWKIGRADITAMQVGDPVVYWRTVTKGRDRGGVVGTGTIASIDRQTDEHGVGRVPTTLVEFYDHDTLNRDDVIEATGLKPGFWQFSLYLVPPSVAEKMDSHLRQNDRRPLFANAVDTERTDLGMLYDRPETHIDYLGRADLALLLAIKLNQAWDAANSEPKPKTVGTRWWSKAWLWALQHFKPKHAQLIDGGFVVHVDAPWGGGKTSFANYLARLLNPYMQDIELPDWPAIDKLRDETIWKEEYRKPWIAIQFNAWQHQHVSPPWWCFYQTIRGQAFRNIRIDRKRLAAGDLPPIHPDYQIGFAEEWFFSRLGLNAREYWWRLTAPNVVKPLAVSAFMLVVAFFLVRVGLLAYDTSADKWVWDFGTVSASVLGISAVALGGLSGVRGFIAAFTDSLMSGAPDAARNYEMGAGDPLERFRRHFARMMKRLRRPVLVIIDDLDRCEPRFVVDLLRGIQTILRSPRVVFLILGDRDWIEQAFSEHHKAMKGINVGPEHSFGARFVEKVIQLSLVLPDVSADQRLEFVRELLNIDEAQEHSKPTSEEEAVVAEVRKGKENLRVASSITVRDATAGDLLKAAQAIKDQPTRSRVEKEINREAAFLSAADMNLERETQHRLVPLSPVLPANPRQIKRIINAVALFQEIARLTAGIHPGSDDWRRLAQWVVLMTEYPQTWFTLSRYPGLADEVLRSLGYRPTTSKSADDKSEGQKRPSALPDPSRADHWTKLISKDRNVSQLMLFNAWGKNTTASQLDSQVIERFRTIMPATSGSLLPNPPTRNEPLSKPDREGEVKSEHG